MAGDIILGYDGSRGSQGRPHGWRSPWPRPSTRPLTVVFGYEPNPMGGETADYKFQLEKIGGDHLAQAVAKRRRPSTRRWR